VALLVALVSLAALIASGAALGFTFIPQWAAASGAFLSFARSAPTATPSPSATPTPTPPPGPPVPAGTFETHVFTDPSGHSMTYYLYGPDSYTSGATYPVVLLLHGGGESADPLASAEQNRQALLAQAYIQAFTAPSTQSEWPCFVLVPQAPRGERWVSVPPSVSAYTLTPQPSQSLTLAMEIAQSVTLTYRAIDPLRMYLAGVSMGAFGTWEATERWPDVFAAALPVAGAGDPHAAPALKHLPIWAFHGADDAIVPVEASRVMVRAVRAAGGTVCYTEYPGVGHNIWLTEHALSDPQVLAWLFSQTKSPISATAPLSCPAHT
jgi:predicted peptidase